MPDDREPFISRVDLGVRIGQDLTGDEKALQCVDAACEICRDTAEQLFNEVEDDIVVLNGTGTDALLLPQLPVTDVSDVMVGDDLLEEGTDWVVDMHGVLYRMGGVPWPKGRLNVTVTYTHGYMPDDLPRSVRMVALALAERLFTRGQATYETLGAYSVRYDGNPTDLTKTEAAILRKYKRSS